MFKVVALLTFIASATAFEADGSNFEDAIAGKSVSQSSRVIVDLKIAHVASPPAGSQERKTPDTHFHRFH
jgi:hypothetical protein